VGEVGDWAVCKACSVLQNMKAQLEANPTSEGQAAFDEMKRQHIIDHQAAKINGNGFRAGAVSPSWPLS
jgi:hypothetical protein